MNRMRYWNYLWSEINHDVDNMGIEDSLRVDIEDYKDHKDDKDNLWVDIEDYKDNMWVDSELMEYFWAKNKYLFFSSDFRL